MRSAGPVLMAITAILLCSAASTHAQVSIPWYTVANGGLVATSGGPYQLSGTIGQAQAGRSSSFQYFLQSGFWGAAIPDKCAGDGNCDGVIDWRDIDYLVAAQNDNYAAWLSLFEDRNPPCSIQNLDASGDYHIDWRDIDPFVAAMNQTCQ